MKRWLILVAAAALLLGAAPARALEFIFAEPEAARDILLGQDDYFARMSAPELAIRLQSPAADKSAGALKAQYARNVLAFSEVEKAQYREVIAAHREELDTIAAHLPETIYFIKTTAKVEGGLPHTHANAIIVPETYGPLTPGLLFHEAFHVLSRRQDEKRASLYALIGFAPCAFQEPPSVAAIHLTNPDVPAATYYVPVGQGVEVIPFLYAARPAFDPEIEGGFPGHFGFGLLRVNVSGETCKAVLDADGEPVLLNPAETPGYFEAIGKNTGYIIHPEEVLADNFSFLMMGKDDLPNPEIPARLARWLGLP